MQDFTLFDNPDGTLIAANTHDAKTFIVHNFRMMADPILDDIGRDLTLSMIRRDGLTVLDCREGA